MLTRDSLRAGVATEHARAITFAVMEHRAPAQSLVVGDRKSVLGCLLSDAYAQVLGVAALDFSATPHEQAKQAFRALSRGDLAILVQSESFRIEDYRIRAELSALGVKVVAHSNLAHVADHEVDIYLDALAYDPGYYRGVGYALKARIDNARGGRLESGEGHVLTFASPFEEAKINIGDFSTLKTAASQFPIGEVFTEARDLCQVSGSVRLYAFSDLRFHVVVPPAPVTLHIEEGRVVGTTQTCVEFEAVLDGIRRDEGEVWVRELGFGMNPAFSPTRTVTDVGAFERVLGTHLSLGVRHAVYKKPGFPRAGRQHHIDVFPITERFQLDEQIIFEGGRYRLP